MSFFNFLSGFLRGGQRRSNDVAEIARRLSKSAAKAEAKRIRALPKIRLRAGEVARLEKEPVFLDELIERHTGKFFDKGCLEFCARLDKGQLKAIWQFGGVNRNIKAYGIRESGVHEWLLCENFCDFLTNPKWGEDGAVLAVLMTRLVQPTDSIEAGESARFPDGTSAKGWTHKDEEAATLGGANNPKSIIHNLSRKIVQGSRSAAEVIGELNEAIESGFSARTYGEFSKALERCLK